MTLRSHPFAIEHAERHAAPWLERYAADHGLSVTAYREAVRVHLKTLLEHTAFWVFMRRDRLQDFLDGGELRGVHDFPRWPTLEHSDAQRLVCEEALLNVPHGTRVIYGALTETPSVEGLLGIYGDVGLRLRMPQDATFIAGDSLSCGPRWWKRERVRRNEAGRISDLLNCWADAPDEARRILTGCARRWRPDRTASLVTDPHELSWLWGGKRAVDPLTVLPGQLAQTVEWAFGYIEAHQVGRVTLADVEAAHFGNPAPYYAEIPRLARLGVQISRERRAA